MKIKSNPDKTILTIAIGFVLIYSISDYQLEWALITGVLVGLLGLISKRIAIKIEWLWFKIAEVLGYIVPNILLTILYYLFLFPVAFLNRLISKKNLLQLRKPQDSSWIVVEKQFSKKDLENPW